MGRPRKPIPFKLRDGDTHKVGAKRFAEEMEKCYLPSRGAPPYPEELVFEPQELLPGMDPAKHAASERDRECRLAVAAEHYEYLCEVLGGENMLCVQDKGCLVAASLAYSGMNTASGDEKAFRAYASTYLEMANALGLNERARSTIPKPAAPKAESPFAAMRRMAEEKRAAEEEKVQ